MKAILVACALALSVNAFSQTQAPEAKVDDPEQKFIALGELQCQNHKKLGRLLVENTETFVVRLQENGYRRAKESELIVVILCRDDKAIGMVGANFETLRQVEIPKQSEPQDAPLPKSRKSEVSL